MPSETAAQPRMGGEAATAGPRNDLAEIFAKLDSALVGVRIAEKMALDASSALERLSAKLARPAPAASPPILDDRLAVSHAEAGRILSRNRQTIWRRIRAGQLELTADGRITMESIRRLARPKAKQP